MRSLWWKLLSAFALVVGLSAVVNATMVSLAAREQYFRFVAENNQAQAKALAAALADYYDRNGSWQGIEVTLLTPAHKAGGETASLPGWWSRWHSGDQGDWGPPWARPQLMLADHQGVILADTTGEAIGQTVSGDRLTDGVPIRVDDQQVGTVLSSASIVTEPTAMNYLISTYHSIWLSSLVTGILAMGLGIFLFRQIVAPIRAVTAAAQQIASGQLQHRVSVTSRDEVGQLAETFNQMADALANDLQTRRNLIADVAHELRTPLSVIRANLEAMLDGVLPANDQEIASLHEEVTLLSRLVTDLNLLSIAEAGQLKLEQIEIAPAELVYRVIERMATQAEAQAITLLEEVAPALPMVRADADRLGQVLVNLVGNALRYTPAKGQVIVRAYQETARSIEPEVIISVSDTGSGIAPEDLPHVFDRFYRADKSRTRTSGGSGIGLAIVKQLVEVHGGRVWVESQLGQGTTFFLTLPPS